MKFRVMMKTPDALDDAITRAMEETVENFDEYEGPTAEDVRQACGKWFRYGEILTVEINTDAGTCEVVEA